jgi:cytochrome c oxidase subunit II
MNTDEHRSSWAAFLFPAVQFVMVAGTVFTFISGRFAPPKAITAAGEAIDLQYHMTLAVAAVVFILSQLGLAYVVLKYRDHGQRVQFTRGNNVLEAASTSLTAILFIGLGLLGGKAWANGRMFEPNSDANLLRIEVTENQFVFNFRYPGPDGKFGRIDPKKIDSSLGNPLGLDSSDPASADDIVVPTLTVPVNQEVELLLRSQDVIHSFFVRELRLQQDAVPGSIVPVRFKAEQIGKYEVVCTQLCGLGHSSMHTYLNVVSQEDFVAFLKSNAG